MRYSPNLYLISVILFIVLAYSVFFIFNNETIELLGVEDGLFESLTALFFLIASIFFLLKYLQSKSGNDFILSKTKKNLFFLILALVFFMGFGEEINWGQRIFNFKTPELFMEINVQQEFNIHNIEMFNYRYCDHTRKSGLAAMLTITGLYNIFWFSYGILIPILNRLSSLVSYWLKKINLPVMPIWIGIFLMINSIIYSILEKLLPPSDSPQFLDTLCEIRECNYAFVFMLVGFYFYNRIGRRLPANSQQLGA